MSHLHILVGEEGEEGALPSARYAQDYHDAGPSPQVAAVAHRLTRGISSRALVLHFRASPSVLIGSLDPNTGLRELCARYVVLCLAHYQPEHQCQLRCADAKSLRASLLGFTSLLKEITISLWAKRESRRPRRPRKVTIPGLGNDLTYCNLPYIT